MANYQTLISDIQRDIRLNGQNAITGEVLQLTLLEVVGALGKGYQFMGFATPATNPNVSDEKIFYFAQTEGTYTHFNNIVVNSGELAILYYDSSWHKQTINVGGGGMIGIQIEEDDVAASGLVVSQASQTLLTELSNIDPENVPLTYVWGQAQVPSELGTALYTYKAIASGTSVISESEQLVQWAFAANAFGIGNVVVLCTWITGQEPEFIVEAQP